MASRVKPFYTSCRFSLLIYVYVHVYVHVDV